MKEMSELLFDRRDKLTWQESAYMLMLVVTVPYFALYPFGFEIISRASNQVIMFLHFSIFIFATILKFQKKQDIFSVTLIFLTFFLLLTNALLNGFHDFDVLLKIMFYISIFMMVFYSSVIPFTKRTIDCIAGVAVALSLSFVCLYFSPYAYRRVVTFSPDNSQLYEIDDFSYLTLGYSNPNLTAILLMVVIYILIALFVIYKQRFIKVVFACLALFLVYMLYLTKSRASIVAVSIFFIIFCSRTKLRISPVLVSIVLISVCLFPFIYLLAYQYDILSDEQILNIEKKTYSGREIIYIESLTLANEAPILGNANYRFKNAHNGMLAIYLSGGIVNVVLYILFFAHNLAKRFERDNKYAYYPLLGIICLYFHSYGEAALMVAGGGFASLMSMLYVLTNARVSRIQRAGETFRRTR